MDGALSPEDVEKNSMFSEIAETGIAFSSLGLMFWHSPTRGCQDVRVYLWLC